MREKKAREAWEEEKLIISNTYQELEKSIKEALLNYDVIGDKEKINTVNEIFERIKKNHDDYIIRTENIVNYLSERGF